MSKKHLRVLAVVMFVFIVSVSILYAQERVELDDNRIADSTHSTNSLLQSYIRRLTRAEDMAGIGHWEFHLNEGIVIASDGAKQIYGLFGDTWEIPAVQSIPLAGYREMLDTTITRLISSGDPYDVQFRIQRPNDGAIIHIHSIAEYDPERNVVFGTIMDITNYNTMVALARQQRDIIVFVILLLAAVSTLGIAGLARLLTRSKQSEQQLQQSILQLNEQERQLNTFMDNMPGMAYRCSNDEHWTMSFVSGGSTALSGYEPNQLVGSQTMTYRDSILPEYRDTVWKGVQHAIVAGKPFALEYRILCASGEIKWVFERGCGVYDDSGNLRFIEGLVIDISGQKQAENAAQKRERDLDVTLQSIGDAVIATDINGNITRMNPVAIDLTGWSLDEAKGKPLQSVFHIINTITREPVCDPVSLVLKSGQIVGLANHTSLMAKDGSEYQIADSASPIVDKQGSIQGVILVFHDVTDLYKQTQALADREQQLRQLFVHSISGIAIHKLLVDEAGQPYDYIFLEANEAFEQHTDMRVADILGKRVTEVQPGIEETGLIAIYGAVVQSGEPITFEHYVKPSKRYYAISAYRISADTFAVVFDDITNRKQSEADLKASELRFRQLVELAPDAIFVQTNGLFSYLNQAAIQLFGAVVQSDLINQPVLERIHPEHRTEILQQLDWLTNKQQAVSRVEEVFLTLDGTPIAVDFAAVPIPFSGTQGVLVYAKDIRGRKEAEVRLRYMMFHDPVTDLYNRTFFEEEIKRLDTKRQLPLSLIMVDMNGLKIINDSLGHSQGDMLLQRVGKALKTACREEDIVARFGGDEFVALLPATTYEQARRICERIEQVCQQMDETEHVKISLAIGCATKKHIDRSIEGVLKQAEDAMYQHKMKNASSSRSALVRSLRKVLGEKSYETEDHARLIQSLATNLGAQVGVSSELLQEISLLALLHDIGTVAIQESILNKPEPLTSKEREIINRHPEIGYRIAAASPDLAYVADSILSHHEWWNGRGYPRGLSGKAIPLSARIVALVDAFVAMTSERPYRVAMATETALDELVGGAGSQFDPHLVCIFTEMIKQEQAAAAKEEAG